MTNLVRALIADDEPVARRGLAGLLASFEWIEVVAEAAHGAAAAEAIDRLRPDVVFLDIQMPGLSGLEVLTRVQHRPRVVFTTAYAQHAVEAFELGALDYLLKPFGRERLATALERLRLTMGSWSEGDVARFREVSEGKLVRLYARTTTAVVPIAVDQVLWFEARGDYVAAHLEGARHLLHLSLAALEARLDPERFARIHRAHLVNLRAVREFRRAGKDRFLAVLTSGVELPVSRQRAQQLKDRAR